VKYNLQSVLTDFSYEPGILIPGGLADWRADGLAGWRADGLAGLRVMAGSGRLGW